MFTVFVNTANFANTSSVVRYAPPSRTAPRCTALHRIAPHRTSAFGASWPWRPFELPGGPPWPEPSSCPPAPSARGSCRSCCPRRRRSGRLRAGGKRGRVRRGRRQGRDKRGNLPQINDAPVCRTITSVTSPPGIVFGGGLSIYLCQSRTQ